MQIKDIVEHVAQSPENSNKAVLTSMLETLIEESGTTPVIEEKTITENGTYEAVEGIDGYNPITVNVPSGGSGYTKTVLWTNEDPMAPFEEDLIITFDEQIPLSEWKNTYVYIAYCGTFGTFDRYYEGITTETILAEGQYEIAVNSIRGWVNSGVIANQLAAENPDDLGYRLVRVNAIQVTIYGIVNTIYDMSGNFDDIKPYCGVPLQVSLITLN